MGNVTRWDARRAIKWNRQDDIEALLSQLARSDTLSGVSIDEWQMWVSILKSYGGNEVDRVLTGYRWLVEFAMDTPESGPWRWEQDPAITCTRTSATPLAAWEDYECAMDETMAGFPSEPEADA